MAEVLVTGGTGNLGRELVPRLVTKGYAVRVLSRRERPNLAAGARAVRGDLITADGVEDALEGVDVIVHCASGTGTVRGLMYRSAKRTDVDATARMLDVAKRRGLEPVVLYISIVGIDRIPLGYYRAKLETEGVIRASGLPHTILRTTQWHTLALEFCERMTRVPVIAVPKGMKAQLLDPIEVADRMSALLDAGPVGMAPEMGGPAALDFKDIVRTYLRATSKRRAVVRTPVPGKTMAAFRAGYNLTPEHADGRVSWADWLAQRVT